MARKIKQFTSVVEGKDILIDYSPVYKLGIQGPPDTTFKINTGTPIKIGPYGIYEIDLTRLGGQITSLVFDKSSEKVIVDIVYENLGGIEP